MSKIKATYSLDVTTTRALERTAKRWNVSKSEALSRAIRAAEAGVAAEAASDASALLDRLQSALRLTSSAAAELVDDVRNERRAVRRVRNKR